ncbi:hypothetical protein ACFYNX_17365 [Streptomyces sp. NPDC007872]|uniref:hypothetical protein n=1 Tax=Streptomyces sp. NPDC007872 TaxID=3364782 RepID=UPI00368D0A57
MRRRGFGRAAGAVALAALVAGCGIRTTSVPVDAGAAPSRVPCVTAGDGTAGTSAGDVPVRVFLVCGSQLETVDRRSPLPEGKDDADPVRTARMLLTQLLATPSEGERRAGFTTAVRGPLAVKGGRRGDPVGTLRLSRQPEDLTPVALSQVVCSFAESSAGAGDRTVLLGGPGPYAPKRYRCTAELRERPESAPPTAPPPTASASASGPVPGSPSAAPTG